jgi:peptide/nickel transport system substrate-binding protein
MRAGSSSSRSSSASRARPKSKLCPVYVAITALFGDVLESGSFDLALFSYLTLPDSPEQSFGLYGCGGVQNYSGYCQRIVSRDLDQARRILDETQQARVLNRADAQLAKDVPTIPLFQIPFTVASRNDVRNLVIPSHHDPCVNAEKWWLAD